MSIQDALENEAYWNDQTLFWLWPQRWTVPFSRASQKYEPFWLFIGKIVPPEVRPAQKVSHPKGAVLYNGLPIESWIAAGQLPAYLNPGDLSTASGQSA